MDDKKVSLRIEMKPSERDQIHLASALAGFRSMADYARHLLLQAAQREITASAPGHSSARPQEGNQ